MDCHAQPPQRESGGRELREYSGTVISNHSEKQRLDKAMSIGYFISRRRYTVPYGLEREKVNGQLYLIRVLFDWRRKGAERENGGTGGARGEEASRKANLANHTKHLLGTPETGARERNCPKCAKLERRSNNRISKDKPRKTADRERSPKTNSPPGQGGRG